MVEERAPPAEVEAEALAALDRGDRHGALTVLMAGYGPGIYRYCRRLVGDEELARDVHQTVFVQAFEGLGRFRRRSSLRVWLYGIARHRCLDALKVRRRRRRRIFEQDRLPEPAADPPAAEERLAARELAGLLERCLRRLTDAVRAAVLLRYREDFSYPEMARICRERPATLQARVARALPVLRRCLEELGAEA